MAAVDLKVNLPMSRIEYIARRLGSQKGDECPDDGYTCFRHRDLLGYLQPETADNECANCWMHYILRGE